MYNCEVYLHEYCVQLHMQVLIFISDLPSISMCVCALYIVVWPSNLDLWFVSNSVIIHTSIHTTMHYQQTYLYPYMDKHTLVWYNCCILPFLVCCLASVHTATQSKQSHLCFHFTTSQKSLQKRMEFERLLLVYSACSLFWDTPYVYTRYNHTRILTHIHHKYYAQGVCMHSGMHVAWILHMWV